MGFRKFANALHLRLMFCAEIVEASFTFFTYLITLGKDVTFPLITKFKPNRF